METPDILLYHCPGACSQVTVCALEMAGLPYELELINVPAGEQESSKYQTINPMGKVPYAVIDGQGLRENAAILTYIAGLRPKSGVFPAPDSVRGRAEIAGELSFCGGTLHPLVRGLANPVRVTSGDTAGVRERSANLAKKAFGFADARLAERGWWFGTPSIIDVYVNWAVSVGRKGKFDFNPFPHVDSLADRLKEILPAFNAMLAEEEDSKVRLGL